MSSRSLIPLLVLVAAGAHAAPPRGPARYNEAVSPPAQSTLGAAIEKAFLGAAAQRKIPLHSDGRLTLAVQAIAHQTPLEADARPDNETVESALRLYGIVEPPPHLLLARMESGGERALLDEIGAQLAGALLPRHRLLGVATVEGKDVLARCHGMRVPGDEDCAATLVLVALAESNLELQPVPRALALDAVAPLRGKLLLPFRRPEAFLTRPDGQVGRLHLDSDGTLLSGELRCIAGKGRYKVEIAGEDRFGVSVLANFPVYCGVPAPDKLEPRVALPAAPPGPPRDIASVENDLLRLTNEDRARMKLPPLVSDLRLVNVARSHSTDMVKNGFFGHVSPTTGNVADRVRKAGVDAMLVLENVARAYSALEAHRALMDSPGHRANILNKEATHVGIAVVATTPLGGGAELTVTEVFMRPPERFDEARTPAELRRRLASIRAARKLPAWREDEHLTRAAQKTAGLLAEGRVKVGAPLHPATYGYAGVRTVVAVASAIDQIDDKTSPAISDPNTVSAGIGVAPGRRQDGSAALYVVILLGLSR